ncbi:hypothetical protein AVEN_31231-1 [Araneus ventricosus]|uniref:Uncharacterized protein n=1 Tax=Araneus ventricosus TaxID=182803 RepID=A0A4Y2J1Y5_ARAVE|nr:hypothetical protein AVEN_31231-1 [Araneus ventricosus]
MDFPCKPLCRSLRFPRATGPAPPPTFKTGLPQWFCGFRYGESLALPPPRSHFSFMAQQSKLKSGADGFPNFSTTPIQFTSEFHTEIRFGSYTTEFADVVCP